MRVPALPESLQLSWSFVSRPLRARFGISRGSKNYATSLRVELRSASRQGWGESVPYRRYGERLPTVIAKMREVHACMQQGRSLDELLDALEGGCVREAIDAARWDLLCKIQGRRIYSLLGIEPLPRVATCYTISLDRPEAMAKQSLGLREFRSLKLKLGGDAQDLERIQAVARARPDARLLADANEAWDPKQWPALAEQAAQAGLSLIEQPFAAGQDQALAAEPSPIPCFADESVHGIDSLPELVGRYSGVNIKLGKCGGVDRALEMIRAAKAMGFKVMVGCMVGSSRSIAPAVVLASLAEEVDLDAHLWLAHDLRPSLRMSGDEIHSDFSPALWG